MNNISKNTLITVKSLENFIFDCLNKMKLELLESWYKQGVYLTKNKLTSIPNSIKYKMESVILRKYPDNSFNNMFKLF